MNEIFLAYDSYELNETLINDTIAFLILLGILEAPLGCHDNLILGKSPIKWRRCPDMTIDVDWDAKAQLKQTQTKRKQDSHY